MGLEHSSRVLRAPGRRSAASFLDVASPNSLLCRTFRAPICFDAVRETLVLLVTLRGPPCPVLVSWKDFVGVHAVVVVPVPAQNQERVASRRFVEPRQHFRVPAVLAALPVAELDDALFEIVAELT